MSDRGLPRYQSHVDGNGVPPSSGAWFESEDPYTGKPWALVGRGGAYDVERGRESGSEAIKDYLQTKCVWMSSELDVHDPFIRH